MSTTKTEWQLDHDTAFGRDQWSILIDGKPRCIVECFDEEGNGTSGAEQYARLIASAPDLLDAVRNVIQQWEANRGEIRGEDVQICREALAKATSERTPAP